MLDVEIARYRDDPLGTTYSDYWIEAPCFRGVSCANQTYMTGCKAGTWCPRGNAGPLECDPLSACGERAFFPVNFIAPIIALLLTAIVVGVSTTLVCRQRAAAARCRAAAAKGTVREVASLTGLSSAGDLSSIDSSSTASTKATAAAEKGLDFVFNDLTYAIGGTTLLHDVSGRAAPGRLTAILGPSGSGKTLLMSLLSGRTMGTVKQGTFEVNGVVIRGAGGSAEGFERLKSSIGYVPKDDVLDRELSARELFTLSARLRLPAGTSEAQISATVEDTLKALGLSGVSDVLIGGSASTPANISGGQLKRVSVGMELVAKPRALFLDESTSGLDATAALDLVTALHNISRTEGVTVVAVLQQPRVEVWRLIDNVIIMAKQHTAVSARDLPNGPVAGGSIVYHGKPANAVAHFTQPALGYALPAGKSMNPADFCTDVAAGLIKPSSYSSVGNDVSGQESFSGINPLHASAVDLAAAWRRYGPGSSSLYSIQRSSSVDMVKGIPPPPVRPGFLAQLSQQARRGFVVRMRGVGMLALYGFLHIFLSVALSSGFSPLIQGDYGMAPVIPEPLQAFVPSFLRDRARFDIGSEGLQQMMFFVTVACGVASGVAASALFASARSFAKRDVATGLSPTAFGLGRMLADVLIVAWDASLFTAVWMLLGASGHWYNWLAIYCGVAFAGSGIGYITGALFSPASAAMLNMVACLFFAVFSGIEPPLVEVQHLPIVNWAWYLSFGTWTAQAVYITFTEYWEGIRNRQSGADKFGFDISAFGTSIGAMFGIGLMFRVVALLALRAATKGEAFPGLRAARRVFCRRVTSGASGDATAAGVDRDHEKQPEVSNVTA